MLFRRGTVLQHIKLANINVRSFMALYNALGVGVVGKELWNRCGRCKSKVMCVDRWEICPWLLNWCFNIVLFVGWVGTITIHFMSVLAVEAMAGSCYTMMLNHLAFMKDKMGMNAKINEAII